MTTLVQQFLRKHPIFTYTMFAEAISAEKVRSPHTIKALIMHHTKHGHIVPIRRRLFAAIPFGANPKTYPINPYLIAGYVTDDATIAYHTALSFYNMAYSLSYRFTFLTEHQFIPFTFRAENYEGIKFSSSLLRQEKTNSFVNIEDVQGMNVRVTSLERTLVDVLDKPLLGGGWEEIWRSLAMIDRAKIDNIIEYALLLDKATTIAKVGFYLSEHRTELNVSQNQLTQLRAHRPLSPHYVDSIARKDGKFIAEWNIIVPQSLITKIWEE